MADETMTVPRNGRLAAKLGEWAQTGVVVVTVLVSGIRWSTSVDNRLGTIESTVASQRDMLENAVTQTAKHAAMAAQAAERAEAAVSKNEATQGKVIAATADNRKAIDKQTGRMTALQGEVAKQLEALSWRVRQLEEQNRKVLDKKGKED